ncbi:hypothetical protein J7E99_22220 [Streptomyces sp. ISL-44]|uniref:hypothetical protein n=1 Tax=Streptomyces sp. ISL-44 TaxID=2819184 RepID=UPI001BEABC1C|nr:hypothetical protein [Streptomyces sp. ISL-44]MBT2543336.1 hypothetical protein [Streptomyces sp. ISL-44]
MSAALLLSAGSQASASAGSPAVPDTTEAVRHIDTARKAAARENAQPGVPADFLDDLLESINSMVAGLLEDLPRMDIPIPEIPPIEIPELPSIELPDLPELPPIDIPELPPAKLPAIETPTAEQPSATPLPTAAPATPPSA